MKKLSLLISLGSGQEAWLSIVPDSITFSLETENGRKSVERLSWSELTHRFPRIAGLMADILAQAMKSHM